MFTGIVTDIGEVLTVSRDESGACLRIGCAYPPDELVDGASVCCSGVCLTITEKGRADGRSWFSVDLSNETLSHSTASRWTVGTRLNLERALRLSDELGGHLVTGHVDDCAEIINRLPDGHAICYWLRAPAPLRAFIAEKGAVTLDGVSLTVNQIVDDRFSVCVIPHSLEATTWQERRVGESVNLEVDIIARYVARLYRFNVVESRRGA